MTSTYSPNLKLTLMGTGDQSGTWGDTTNTNLGTLVEEAIAGYTTQALTGAGPTALTIPDGATSVGRNYVIEFTGTPTAGHTVTVPAVDKPYILFNNTNIALIVKVSGQTGFTIAVGKKAIAYTNSTDLIEVANAPVTEAGTQTLTNKTLTSPTIATPTITTSATVPLVIGGTAVSSALTLQSTSGVGTSDSIAFKVGNNGATTAMTVNTSGSVGIGTSSPSTKLNVYNATSAAISVDGDGATTLRSTRYSTDSTPTELILRKARGTLASPSTVATSDTTGGLYFQAYGGTNFRNVGRIDGLVETYTSDSNIAGALRFYTNNSSTDVGERMRISSTGNVGIGATGLTTSSLRVSKSITGDTTAQSIRSDGAIQTDVTSQAFYFISSANMASGTLGSLFHYAASQGTIGATVTNQSGFASISSLIGATNNFAFNAQDTAAVTAGKTAYGYFSAVNTATGGGTTYGFYANGTANNYFGGNVGIGSTSLTGYSLRVAKNITGAAIGYGVFADGAIQSDVTTAAYFATSGNAGSTLSNLFHYTAGQGTLGATVGVQHGFRAESSLIGATNNFGFVASNTAAVTAGKTAYGYYSAVNTATGGGTTYGFYAAGTAINYFNGNVGIGTAAPATPLHVSGYVAAGGQNYSGRFSDALNSTYSIGHQSGLTNLITDTAMAFYTSNTERMRIDTNGNVMTGATSATFASSTFKLSVTEGTAYTPFGINNNAAGVGATNVVIFARNGTQTGAITVTGTTTAYATSSDYRLKENVQPMNGALAKVALLKPCTYQWKADGSDGEGFLAHELAEVCHHAVFGEKDATNDEGDILAQSVDASFLIATLTAAIQEQQAMITALTARITALEVTP